MYNLYHVFIEEFDEKDGPEEGGWTREVSEITEHHAFRYAGEALRFFDELVDIGKQEGRAITRHDKEFGMIIEDDGEIAFKTPIVEFDHAYRGSGFRVGICMEEPQGQVFDYWS